MGIPADNSFVAFLTISLVIGAATAWRYDWFKKLLGPILAVSVIIAAYTVYAVIASNVAFGVQLSSGYGLGLMLLALPAMVLAYALLLLVPSAAFYVVIKAILRMVNLKHG